MISLPRKLVYAIEAVLYVAYNVASGPVSSKEIAGHQGLPPRYLEQLMQRLVRAGVLRGVRGPRGGYLLARERRRISLREIAEVLYEEEDALADTATPLGQHIVTPLLVGLREAVMEELEDINLADLCERAAAAKIIKRDQDKLDFAI